MSKRKQKKSKYPGDIFDEHVKHEFIDHDVASTMKTVVNEPIVHNVPVLTGGVGFDNVFNFVCEWGNNKVSENLSTIQLISRMLYL
jgi:hypothetical protein